MHIVYLCNEYPPDPGGGVGTFTQASARALVRQGHEATSIGFSRAVQAESVTDDAGVRVIRLPVGSVRGVAALSEQRRLWAQLRTLAGQGATVLDGPELSYWAGPRSFPVPRVLRMNGGHHFFSVAEGRKPLAARARLERRSFARADHLIAVSEYVGTETARLLDLGDRPIDIIPNAVDTDLFRPATDDGLEPGLVLFVGTVCEKKGIRQLVLGFREIVDAFPEAHLVVAGRDTDRDLGRSFTASLREQVGPDVGDRIEFLGAVEHAETRSLLARAHVCAYPSHMEAQGIVFVEAMASGKAVVGGDVGPGREVVEDGTSGLLCDPHDPASIAKAVVRVLTDDALRLRLEAGGRQRALERFSVDEVTRRNLEVYGRAAAGGA